MLNFSKIKIFTIYLILLILSSFSLLNLQNENFSIIEKKVNLGLDLQGGSYLLLEIDTKPLLKERLQEKIIPLKKNFLQTITLNIQTLILKKRLYHLISKMINYPNLKHCLIKKKKIISIRIYKDIILMN